MSSLRDGDRLPVGAEGARHRRRRPLRGRGVLHRPVAARGRRLHRQARRRDRHRLVGHPVDPDHRRRRPTSSPCSSARRTSRCRPATARSPTPSATAVAGRPRRLPRSGPAGREPASRPSSRPRVRSPVAEDERRRRLRGGVGRRASCSASGEHVHRPGRRPEAANDTFAEFVRDKIRADRRRPGDGRAALPDELLRSAPSGRASTPTTSRPTTGRTSAWSTSGRRRSQTITETGIDIDGRVDRVRRDRVRDRLRRDDRRAGRGRHRGPRRRHAEGEVGTTARSPTSGSPSVGFPNLFMITGPGQPVGAVEHDGVDRAARRLDRRHARPTCASTVTTTIEPTEIAEAGWVQHVNDCADITLYPKANSWYMGANVPGKPRVFLPYVGGVDTYRAICDGSSNEGYLGFRSPWPRRRADQRRRGQPAAARRDAPAARRWPSSISRRSTRLPVPEARAFMTAMRAQSPPGPEVGEVVDGTLPGAAGDLDYRLYRPATRGATPGGVLLPRRRLGARRARVGRSVLPRPVRAVRRARRVGRLSPRTRGPVPGGGRRRVRRPSSGSPTNASRARWRSPARSSSPAGAPAATSPRWWPSVPATRAARRSPGSC